MNDTLSQVEQRLLAPAELDPQALAGVLERIMATPGVDAADLYFQHQLSESWALEDGLVKDGSFNLERGVGVRAQSGEKTGFAYSNEIALAPLQQAAQAAADQAGAMAQGAIDQANQAMDGAREAANQVVNDALAQANQALDQASEQAGAMATAALDQAQAAVDSAQAQLESAVQQGLEAAREQLDQAQQMAEEAAQEALNQAEAMVDNAIALVEDAAQQALDAATDAIGQARELLAGAHAIDRHFAQAPLRRNLPVMLGLVGFFHRVVCSYPTRAVIPYDQRLARLPAYLQQLDMESNGKSVTLAGAPVATPTGPVVWGEPGTNGQHAFFQLLHQGTDVVPVEFIVAAKGHEPGLARHHDLLVANCLAQSEALMKGRTLEEARAQMLARGVPQDEVEAIAPHRVFPGNRPSLTLMHRRLDPFSLGRLIALYEHRVFVEAQLFGINAFDQWGVELGKELATGLLPVVEGREDAGGRDASTAGLVRHMRSLRAKE